VTKTQTGSDQALRLRAENNLSVNKTVNPETLSPEEINRLFHELRVHQIELEMQNEELRRTQNELECSRARYFDLYDLAPVGYLTLSEQGLIQEANLAAATMLGATRSELFKQPISRIILKDDQDTYYLLSNRLLKIREPQACDLRLVRRDGTVIWAHLAATVEQDPSRHQEQDADCTVLRVVLSDISERKRAEENLNILNKELDDRVSERTFQLEMALREQEAFSYTVSHDLRSPLRHINSYLAILTEEFGDGLPPEALPYLARSRAASALMGKMIDRLLELSRVGRIELVAETVNLSEMASTIVTQLKEMEPARDVDVVIAASLKAKCDNHLVYLVLFNLFDNAWKYSARGKRLFLEFGRKVINGEEIFFVKDNGIGFDMAYYDKVFGAFHRLHGNEYDGLGIGLATVKRIIERHGGTVWAKAEVGAGATFYFNFPKTEQIR